MKNLVRFGAALIACAFLGSCGIPLAAVRSVKKAPQTVSNAYTILTTDEQ